MTNYTEFQFKGRQKMTASGIKTDARPILKGEKCVHRDSRNRATKHAWRVVFSWW